MSTVEVDTGTIVKRYSFWSPETWSIPKLYWDSFSQEQRTHAICRQLSKVIGYADYLGVNVDDIAQRLTAIENGELSDLIIAEIEAWFEEHGEDIINRVNAIESDDWVTSNRIADSAVITSKIADNAVISSKIANDSITSSKIENGTIVNEDIADNSINGNEKIADSSISADKLNSSILNSLKTSLIGSEMVSIGDSYFYGSQDNDASRLSESSRMQFILANMLGLTNHDYSVGGTGFAYSYQGASTHMIDLVNNAIADSSYTHSDVALIVIGAGRNDTASGIDSTLATQVNNVFNTLHAAFPNAKILYFFNYDWGSLSGGSSELQMLHNMTVIYRTIHQNAGAQNGYGIITDETSWCWFLSDKQWFGTLHPNESGHRAFAMKMYNMLFGNSSPECKVYNEGGIASDFTSSSWFAQRSNSLLNVYFTGITGNAISAYTTKTLLTIYNCGGWGTDDGYKMAMVNITNSIVAQAKLIKSGNNLLVSITPYAEIPANTRIRLDLTSGWSALTS